MPFYPIREMHVLDPERHGGRERALAGLVALAAHLVIAALLLLSAVHQVTAPHDEPPVVMTTVSGKPTPIAAEAPPAPRQLHVARMTIAQPEIAIVPEATIAPRPIAEAAPETAPATSSLTTAMAMAPSGGGAGAAGAGGGGGAGGFDINPYLRRVAFHIQTFLRLPYIPSASVQNSLPRVIVHLVWKKDGTIEKVEIVTGSGHSRIDDAALAAVQRAQPLPPFPPELKGETINGRLPIVFYYRYVAPTPAPARPQPITTVTQPTAPSDIVQSKE